KNSDGQPITELLGIAGERTAIQFKDMLFSAFTEEEVISPVRIVLEYHPPHRPDGNFGPVIWYRISMCGEECSEELSGESLAEADSAFS
ncbi:MAG: hypothetical protein Q7S76_04205, partial [bacterium]|nr:hypothetical protein [bacterium]